MDRILDSMFFDIMIDKTVDIFVTNHLVVFLVLLMIFILLKLEKNMYNIQNINKNYKIMKTKIWL